MEENNRWIRGGSRWIAVVGSHDQVVNIDEYTLDLNDRAGTRLDVVLMDLGDAAFIDARIHLIGPDGVSVLRSSSADPLGSGAIPFDQAIVGAYVASDGTYTLRLTAVHARGD